MVIIGVITTLSTYGGNAKMKEYHKIQGERVITKIKVKDFK